MLIQVTVLFADIVGFTPMCKDVAPSLVMSFLNDLYSRFDQLLDIYGVYKVRLARKCNNGTAHFANPTWQPVCMCSAEG